MATSLMTWDPMRELAGIRQQFDRMLGEPAFSRAFVRNVPFDLYETEDDVIARVALPGVKSENVDISVEQGVLHIRGAFPEYAHDPDRAEPTWHYRGIWQGQFGLDLALPSAVQPEEAQANVHDGILVIRLPKAEWARRRRIQVQVES